MDVFARSFSLALATSLVALPLAGSAALVGRRWLLGSIGLLLGLSPPLVAVIVSRFIISAQGLTLKP
jgi:hypothetical protein